MDTLTETTTATDGTFANEEALTQQVTMPDCVDHGASHKVHTHPCQAYNHRVQVHAAFCRLKAGVLQ